MIVTKAIIINPISFYHAIMFTLLLLFWSRKIWFILCPWIFEQFKDIIYNMSTINTFWKLQRSYKKNYYRFNVKIYPSDASTLLVESSLGIIFTHKFQFMGLSIEYSQTKTYCTFKKSFQNHTNGIRIRIFTSIKNSQWVCSHVHRRNKSQH